MDEGIHLVIDDAEIVGLDVSDSSELIDMRGMTALVVDDAISILKMISFILSKEGVTVSQAKNGKEAVDKMQQFIFDFVIMDIQMPVMNGFDAVREVRRLERLSGSSPQTIIGISAQYDGYTVPYALAEGFDLFLAKPFTMEAISRHLKSIKGDSEGGGVFPHRSFSSLAAITPHSIIAAAARDNDINDADADEVNESPV